MLAVMAWRIHDNVIRGEIDNRERGVVKGRLWLAGVPGPLILDLKGNAGPDLAGCLLTFENPGKKVPMQKDALLNPVQRGSIGDLTASRKVRVFDIPFDEAYAKLKKNEPVPEHLANCLYLEWFSDANGRVVVESADYKLTISAPAWRLTPAEEEQRQKQAAEGFSGFMQKLSDALEASKHQPPEEKVWDEFDYEKFLRECDARTDKYGELLDKYRDHPDRDRIIAKEMGWTWVTERLDAQEADKERQANAESESEPEQSARAERDIPSDFPDDAETVEPDPATEGVDWIRTKDGDVCHPLAARAFEGSVALYHKCDELGLNDSDDDLATLQNEYQTTSAKLAGALDGLAYGRDLSEGAFIVAYLKRALSHLHAAQAALEKVAPKNLLPAALVSSTRTELFALREEVLRLMDDFRSQQ